MNYSKLVISAIAFICVASTPAMAAKNYYKWTDAEGVTHYSAQRPNDVESEIVSISSGRKASGDTSTENESASTAKRNIKPAGTTGADLAPGETAEVYEKDPARCKAAKDILETLKNYTRIRTKDENGVEKVLDDKEKAARKEEAQKAIKESC